MSLCTAERCIHYNDHKINYEKVCLKLQHDIVERDDKIAEL